MFFNENKLVINKLVIITLLIVENHSNLRNIGQMLCQKCQWSNEEVLK